MQIGNLHLNAGYLSYYEDDNGDKPIAIGIVLGVVIPIIAIIILLAICVIRRHRKNKPSQNYIPDVWKETEEPKDEDEIALNHVSVKADMNGSIPDDKGNSTLVQMNKHFEHKIVTIFLSICYNICHECSKEQYQ